MKAARGLPKFAMECGFWRHKNWVGAGLAAIGLQACGVSYCYEHETDGNLPGPAIDDLASALGLRSRDVRAALKICLEKGRWLATEGGYCIAGFGEHNPLSAELQEHRLRRSDAAKRAADARWKRSACETDSGEQCEPHANSNSLRTPKELDLTSLNNTDIERPPRSRGKPKTFIDDEFQVTDEMAAWVVKTCPQLDWRLQSQRFVNHWKGLKEGELAEGRKSSWRRTWDNWMLSEYDRMPAYVKKQSELKR